MPRHQPGHEPVIIIILENYLYEAEVSQSWEKHPSPSRRSYHYLI